MGEKQNRPFRLSFNASLKIDFQGARVASDGGLILVRESDQRLGFGDLIARRLTGSRKGKNTQLPLADLLRQSVYSRMVGYKVGVIDIQGAIAGTKEGRKAAAQLQIRWDPKSADLRKKQSEISALTAQLEKSSNTISEVNKEKLVQEIEQKTKILSSPYSLKEAEETCIRHGKQYCRACF